MKPGPKSKVGVGVTVEMSALKALVTLFGPREAARQAGMPESTVLGCAFRYGWKKAEQQSLGKDAGDAIRDAVEQSKRLSTAHLAKFTEKAAAQAADLSDPLKGAKQVSHVAQVYKTLWPAEKQGGMIEGAILIGKAQVTDADIREELPDGRQAGD